MRILVVGAGGREHALAWAISASPLVDRLYCAPGNAGIAEEAECVSVAASDTAGILAFCRHAAIDFVVVGPEAPLVGGLVDALEGKGIAAFGPSAAAAALEGSKGFMKDLCAREGIPTAAYRRFTEPAAAMAHLARHGVPTVIKADGLAAGKGVLVAPSISEAEGFIASLADGRFGDAGREIIIEECLVGEEASFFVLVDGTDALPLAAAQDHKRVGDGDTGANTGGMGAYSPTPAVTPPVEGAVMEHIILPTVRAMARDGRPFKGVLYAGLMLTEAGPKLLEYNVRFGDPECQALMLRLKSDLLPALIAARDGILRQVDLRWRDESALCVVLAAKGYPDNPARGGEIRGLSEAASDPDVKIFHAGTRREPAPAEAGGERLVADGGRVLGVTALGRDLAAARQRAYAAVDRIDWLQGFCRRDIGMRRRI